MLRNPSHFFQQKPGIFFSKSLFKNLAVITNPKASPKQISFIYCHMFNKYKIIPTYSDNVHSDIDVLPEFTASQILHKIRTSLFVAPD